MTMEKNGKAMKARSHSESHSETTKVIQMMEVWIPSLTIVMFPWNPVQASKVTQTLMMRRIFIVPIVHISQRVLVSKVNEVRKHICNIKYGVRYTAYTFHSLGSLITIMRLYKKYS